MVGEEKKSAAEIADRLPTLCVSWRTKGQQLLVRANRLFESADEMRRIPVCPKCVCQLFESFSVPVAMISSHELVYRGKVDCIKPVRWRLFKRCVNSLNLLLDLGHPG
jgi:hypothetical protein